jgi:imidazolonepropionase-like amidohydrolase
MKISLVAAHRSVLTVMMLLALVGLVVAQQNAPTTIRAGVLIDGTGETITEARLIIEDGVITRIDRLRGAVTHDLSGLVVMPGWIDTHVHLASHFDPDGKTHRIRNRETQSQIMLYAVRNARQMLRAGFTTVQSLGGRLDAELRDFIDQGQIPGPRVLTSLEPVTSDTGGPDEIRAFIQQLATDGADVVKVFASGSIRDGGERTLSDEQIEAACSEATAHGLRTAVHAYGTEVTETTTTTTSSN